MKKMIFFVILLFTMNAYTQTHYEITIFDAKIDAYKEDKELVFKDYDKSTEFYIEIIDTENHKILSSCLIDKEMVRCPLKTVTYDHFKIYAMSNKGNYTWSSKPTK